MEKPRGRTMCPMRLPSEYIENLDAKHHGVHLAGMRARSAERAAEHSFAHNPLLIISATAALVTMFFVPPSAAYFDYFNWHTLACLFSVLAVIAGIDSSGLMEFVAHSLVERVSSTKGLIFTLVLTTFGCSMVMSNDMTLVTLLPLATALLKSVKRESEIPLVFIMITLTANFGGMLLPFSKPHNLYLYTAFGVGFSDYIAVVAPPFLLSIALIFARCGFVKAAKFHYRRSEAIRISKPRAAICVVLFALCITMTLGIVPYLTGMMIVVVVLAITDRRVFAKTDYTLVVTFACFFVFSGNIAQIEVVTKFFCAVLNSCGVFATSLLSCQLISNVPTAILLGHFSTDWAGIALGTNIGAVGTPISSLATLITLRQYQKTGLGDNGKFIARFEAYNFTFLVILFLFEVFIMRVH